MKSKLLHDGNGLKTFAIIFDKGDQVRATLLEFASSNRFADAYLTAIGAFSEVTLGFFDRNQKLYKPIPINEQVEVLSFSGNIVQQYWEPALYATFFLVWADNSSLFRINLLRDER